MNELSSILDNKQHKGKAKVVVLSKMFLDGIFDSIAIVSLGESKTSAGKTILLEALELASKNAPEIIDEKLFDWVVGSLMEQAPSIKRESARIVANTCHHFKNRLQKAIELLIEQSQHEGTVVRWSAALALSTILKMKTPESVSLIPKIQELALNESNNGVKNQYLKGLKSIGIR